MATKRVRNLRIYINNSDVLPTPLPSDLLWTANGEVHIDEIPEQGWRDFSVSNSFARTMTVNQVLTALRNQLTAALEAEAPGVHTVVVD